MPTRIASDLIAIWYLHMGSWDKPTMNDLFQGVARVAVALMNLLDTLSAHCLESDTSSNNV